MCQYCEKILNYTRACYSTYGHRHSISLLKSRMHTIVMRTGDTVRVQESSALIIMNRIMHSSVRTIIVVYHSGYYIIDVLEYVRATDN